MNGYRLLCALFIALVFLAGCDRPEGGESGTLVAGKAVHAGMGIEGATITALDTADNTLAAQTLSTYHGSFILHLKPGSYTLEGRAVVPRGKDDVQISGALPKVSVGTERLDRITILMDGEKSDD